eukprot:5972974-Alexandrium_andersonii.AAC.1
MQQQQRQQRYCAPMRFCESAGTFRRHRQPARACGYAAAMTCTSSAPGRHGQRGAQEFNHLGPKHSSMAIA